MLQNFKTQVGLRKIHEMDNNDLSIDNIIQK